MSRQRSNAGILVLVFILLALLGGAAVFSQRYMAGQTALKDQKGADNVARRIQQQQTPHPVSSETQAKLDALSKQMIADLQAESRLNLNMLGQLRSYEHLLSQMEAYAQDVEQQIKIVEEISKQEFQEDVALQASLFSGKKPELVATHLEEFRASRVGAILAKMKDKEASQVLDVWAKKKEPKVSAFYRETMASYLNNKRRDMHPELFEVKQDKDAAGAG